VFFGSVSFGNCLIKRRNIKPRHSAAAQFVAAGKKGFSKIHIFLRIKTFCFNLALFFSNDTLLVKPGCNCLLPNTYPNNFPGKKSRDPCPSLKRHPNLRSTFIIRVVAETVTFETFRSGLVSEEICILEKIINTSVSGSIPVLPDRVKATRRREEQSISSSSGEPCWGDPERIIVNPDI